MTDSQTTCYRCHTEMAFSQCGSAIASPVLAAEQMQPDTRCTCRASLPFVFLYVERQDLLLSEGGRTEVALEGPVLGVVLHVPHQVYSLSESYRANAALVGSLSRVHFQVSL